MAKKQEQDVHEGMDFIEGWYYNGCPDCGRAGVWWDGQVLEGEEPGKPPETTLTCVYCGMAYPTDTPRHGAKILTDHIKVCEKHPLRAAEDEIRLLKIELDSRIARKEVNEAEL